MLTMTKAIICKLLQRRTYDILSQKYSFVIFFLCLVGLIISGFRFGEVVVEWSKEKHSQIFSAYVDNIMGKSYQHNLCQHLPIDVVYTWVNGTDPKLLQDLAEVKLEFEEHLNYSKLEDLQDSSSFKCPYSYCLESHIVILRPRLPAIVTLKELSNSHFIFDKAKKIIPISPEMKETAHLGTVIVMDNKESATMACQRGTITVGDVDYTISPGLITTDWTAPYSIKLQDTIIMTGVPGRLTENEILHKLPPSIQQYMEKIFLYSEVSAAVLIVPDQLALAAVLKLEGNFSIQNREQSLSVANLLIHVPQGIVKEDVSTSRFRDNEELRYSLRSLEKFAPWVRQIFIVTNGQIPLWLNLENPRVTVVAHDELYPDKSHLPTFSSPSIETHLHRIRGLSKKFLYLNDDVVFGKPVWPEDFYTSTKGHKVYLSWAVPDCRDGCPSTWIGDGYCDKPCNNTDCEWDGNDCKDGATGMRFNSNQNVQLWKEESDKLYCSANCANSWLADRYCDQACNVFECAYDAGDCGTNDYDRLDRIDLNVLEHNYTLPSGIFQFYFNLTEFLSDRSVKGGSYEESAAIRIVAINRKFKIITVVLYRNQSTTLSLHLKGFKNNVDYEFNFSVSVDTFISKNENDTKSSEVKKPWTEKLQYYTTNATTTTTTVAPTFKMVAEDLRHPKIKKFVQILEYEKYERINISAVNFPQNVLNELNELNKRLEDKFLTEKGYRIKKSHVIGNYIKELRSSNQTQPEMIYVIEKSTKTEDSFKLRNLKWFSPNEDQRMLEVGAFPWEKKRIFYSVTETSENTRVGQRHLLDTFGDSLRHVNRLLNKQFGYESRKVPAHMAHMMDVDVITDLQARFPKEFEQTSSNKIRSTSDMQFAFSFFYFVMSEKAIFSLAKVFDDYDTDHSGTWSDREIRTVLTQLNDLPISYETVVNFERVVINCSSAFSNTVLENVSTPRFERYLDSKLPTVTKDLILNCSTLNEIFKSKRAKEKKYKYEIVGEEEVAFKMIKTNVSHVIAQLDDIRKNPRKFICLNDDIDHENPDATMVKTILIDFYESFYPIPSQFELSREYRNRFLTIGELKEWRRHRDSIKFVTYSCLIFVILFLLVFLFRVQVRKCFRWCKPRRKVKCKNQESQNV